MLILTIRTDKPEAQLGLYRGQQQLAYYTWRADRELAETIHQKIQDLLKDEGYELEKLDGLVVFKGPGSFTGLRIGISVANALASGLDKAVIGAQSDSWIEKGITELLNGHNDQIVMPEYGAPVHITKAKK